MQLFRKHIKPAWTFKSGKKIWRLLPGQGVLAVELRDTDNKETEFAALDITTGSPLWQNLQFEERWWITVNKFHRDVLLLQQFVKPDMPTPGKIFAVDAMTGKVLWQNDELALVNVVDDLVYGLRSTFTSEEIVGVNWRTGESAVTFSADDPRTQEINVALTREEYMLPVSLEELEDNPLSATPPVRVEAFPSEAKTPSLIETGADRRIIGYHLDAGTDEKGVHVYESHIKIIDRGGKVHFEDTTDRGVYTTLQDFYFVVDNILLYVRNSNEIVAVNLS
ncbi:MAG: DUF4905 domain-containing protein [Bacteroidetes bacterium]|jgi:hypothetical protein|nr:DUF4905 domain-containing protein [Bacteroidota bacterium]